MQEFWSWFAVEVEWAKAILDFLGKIAWPLAATIVLWHWRDVIKNMLADRDLESLELTVSGLILKRSVNESLDEAEQSLAKGESPLQLASPDAGPETSVESDAPDAAPHPLEKEPATGPKASGGIVSTPKSRWVFDRWLSFEPSSTGISENYSAALALGRMLVAYQELETAIRDAVESTGGLDTQNSLPFRSTGTLSLVQVIRKRDLLPESWFIAFNEVRKIRNELTHQATNMPPLQEVEIKRFLEICSQLVKQLSVAVDPREPPQFDLQEPSPDKEQ